MSSLRQRTVRLSHPDEVMLSQRGEVAPVLRDVLARYRLLVASVDPGLTDYAIATVADMLETSRDGKAPSRYSPAGGPLLDILRWRHGPDGSLGEDVLEICAVERTLDAAERIVLADRLDVLTNRRQS